MNNGVKFWSLFFVFAVLLAGFSAASFSYKNHNLQTSYSAGEKVSGTVNISFSAEPANSLIKSNFNGEMKLIDLLKANQLTEGSEYSCTYPGCVDSYVKSASEITGTLALSGSAPLIVGFNLIGGEVEVTELKFTVASSAGESCSRQLLVDVLDKNETFIQNIRSSGDLCGGEESGCFNGAANTFWTDITTSRYCEKVTLSPAPAYRIGGVIKNGTSQSDLIMSLLDSSFESLVDDCVLPVQSSDIQQLGCEVNYSVTKTGDYFICIKSANEAEYQIKFESSDPVCGSSSESEQFDSDFDLFASPIGFAPVGAFSVNSTSFYELNDEKDLVSYVNDYLTEVYQRNCSRGCAVPFKLTGISQDLTFSGALVKYKKSATTPAASEYKFYKFTSEVSKISTAKPVNLEMSFAGLTIPLNSNATKLYLYLNDQAILPAPLTIGVSPSFGFDISPKTVLIGATNNFRVITSANITSSTWNFGDGTTRTVSGKSVSHRYAPGSQISYRVEVELTRADGIKARNSFDVGTGSPRLSADSLIAEYESRLVNLSAQLNAMPLSISGALKNRINVTGMQASLAAIKQTLANASSDGDYLSAITAALAINIPESVLVSEEGKNIPLSFGIESANLNYIEQISGETLGSDSIKGEFKKALSGWLERSYSTSTEYNIVSRTEDNGQKTPVLTYFKVGITKKADAGEDAAPSYLIIDFPEGSINFLGNYSPKTVGSGTYIQIEDSRTIEFILSGATAISGVGMYLSPQISRLTSTGGVPFADMGGFRWGRFIFWMILLLVIAFAVYIALQEWYKRRYESYLFKNPADLYNIITFMHNSRKSGLADSEITKKLKNAGWKGEQITYAFNKLDGKRTGMYEIPIFRFFEQRKIREEIEKRRAGQQSPQTKPLLK